MLPLPGFVATGEPADVTIEYGVVPDSLPGAAQVRVCTQARPGQFLLTVDRVAKYLVENGSRITIQPAPGATDDEVRLFLMGSVWSALLLQRGLLPLHGSAVRVKDRAIVLAGTSGNGKSTLTASLMDLGFLFIADELCALDIKENSPPLLLPGFPQILLWDDSLRILGKAPHSLTPVRPGLEKYIFALGGSVERPPDKGTFFEKTLIQTSPLPLERIYILIVTNTPSYHFIPLHGVRKIHALIDCTYRVHHVTGLGLNAPHFKQCTNIAHYLDVKQVERPASPFDIENLAKLIAEDF